MKSILISSSSIAIYMSLFKHGYRGKAFVIAIALSLLIGCGYDFLKRKGAI